jgi:hypothetical protein
MSALYDAILLGLAVTPFLLAALWLAGRARRFAPAAAFLVLFVLDDRLTALGADMHLNPGGLRWNWVGKLLSIALSMAVITFGHMTRSSVGLTWRQRNSKRAAAVTIGLIVLSAVLLAERSGPNVETLLYQATMPGLAAGHVTFDGMAFFFPMLGGLAFWWLRRVTGSLVFPVLAHNGANVATYLAALWRT